MRSNYYAHIYLSQYCFYVLCFIYRCWILSIEQKLQPFLATILPLQTVTGIKREFCNVYNFTLQYRIATTNETWCNGTVTLGVNPHAIFFGIDLTKEEFEASSLTILTP